MNPEALQAFQSAPILKGSHPADDGRCALEWVAYLAGEKHTDAPECSCPVVSTFIRTWNDALPTDADRDRLLRPLIPKLVGSRATPEAEKQRSYLALDWMIRTFLPTWLERVDALREHAEKVRALEPIRDLKTAEAADAPVRAARVAAWDAAGAAAGAAAWDAARDAARVAAGVAAWDAAWDAARVAARVAAGDAARAAAGDAARAAARAAARVALEPTVGVLQESAADLVERMLACGE